MGNKGSQLSNKNLALLARNANMDESQVLGFPLHLDKIVFVEIVERHSLERKQVYKSTNAKFTVVFRLILLMKPEAIPITLHTKLAKN